MKASAKWSLPLVASMLVFAALVFFGVDLQQGDRLNDVIAVLSCFTPLIVFAIASGKSLRMLWEPSFGLLASGCFFVFFLAGFVQYVANGRTIGFAVVGAVDSGTVRDTLMGCAAITSVFIVGDRLGRITHTTEPRPCPAPHSARPLFLLAQALWLLACYGCFDVAKTFGGIEAATAQLGLHDRNVGIESSGTLGMSLWGTFALPSAITLLVVFLQEKQLKWRLLTLGQAAVILGFGVLMFGSRLLLILTLVAGGFAFFKVYRRGPSLKVVTVILSFFLLVSSAVLGGRAEALNTKHDASFLDSVGYSIFDVSIAATQSIDQLRPQLGSLERSITALSAALPGSGGRAADISAARVDVLVVQAIGNNAQANSSGLPPSLPTSLFLGFELPYALVIALLIGLLLGFTTKLLQASNSPLSVVLFGLWGAFLFNAFKGGDLPLDVGSEARRWFYIIALYFLIKFFFHEKEQNAIGNKASRVRSSRIPSYKPNIR